MNANGHVDKTMSLEDMTVMLASMCIIMSVMTIIYNPFFFTCRSDSMIDNIERWWVSWVFGASLFTLPICALMYIYFETEDAYMISLWILFCWTIVLISGHLTIPNLHNDKYDRREHFS